MKQYTKTTDSNSNEPSRRRRLVAQHLQEIEGNPLDAEDIAMFEMFECEGWPYDKRRAYILKRVRTAPLLPAAN